MVRNGEKVKEEVGDEGSSEASDPQGAQDGAQSSRPLKKYVGDSERVIVVEGVPNILAFPGAVGEFPIEHPEFKEV